MAATFAVKTRVLLLAILCWSGFAGGSAFAEQPDANEILRSVRIAQASQHQTLRGKLRSGGTSIPFRLVVDGPTIQYQFTDRSQTIQLRLLEKDSRLEEITGGSAQKVSAARFDQKVLGTDISYEELAMKFLYWPNARVTGEQTITLRKCWQIRTEPPRGESQYSRVDLWIDQASGALMKAEAFDPSGRMVKKFQVISGQKIEGAWLLKSMRIQSTRSDGRPDTTPTYLEVEGIEK